MKFRSRKPKTPSLMDVANAAGVSTATVSRCLNEPEKVAKPTRDQVLKCVEELRYLPNFGARAIAANRTGIYAAVIPTMENAIFARGIEAFQKSIVANNATMLVGSSAYDPQQEAKLVRTMVARGADGLLLIGTERDPSIHELLRDRNIPAVIAWSLPTDGDISCVGFDNKKSAKALAQTVLSIGHRRFAYVSAPRAENDRARERVAGTIDALKEAGFSDADLPVVEVDYSIENGKSAFREIASSGANPSVIFCGNDVLAVGVSQAVKEAGLRIPQDISVVGFDDIELASVVTPALTTVHVPHQEMGERAALALMALVKGESECVRVEVSTQIIERDSLGPPKASLSNELG